MVFAGQDKWRKHPLIFETWRRPFPMLGTACVVFACIWMGETMYNGYQKSKFFKLFYFIVLYIHISCCIYIFTYIYLRLIKFTS